MHDKDSEAVEQTTASDQEEQSGSERSGMSPRHVIGSVFAAGLGVQSSKNRKRDFNEGSAGTFIAAGLIFTVLFIGGVFLVVQLVLRATS
jgi:hypothetical protein